METEVRTRKGIPNLSDNVKLGILQQKKLQMVPQHIIAQDFSVSRKTVNQLDENDLSPQAKAKLDSFVDKLGQAREKVIQRINEKLDNNDFKDGVYPNLLNAVNNNFRLETNQSTQNIAVNNCVQIANQAYDLAVKLHAADPNEPLPTEEDKRTLYLQICEANGVQADVSLLDAEAGETLDK
jgi:hypothetical protein